MAIKKKLKKAAKPSKKKLAKAKPSAKRKKSVK